MEEMVRQFGLNRNFPILREHANTRQEELFRTYITINRNICSVTVDTS
jgi:hypothetical protein